MTDTHLQDVRERGVEAIHRPPRRHWVGDGFHVAGYLSDIPDGVRRLSPFLLLDYHAPENYPPSPRPRGVGVHPHRGFETVTLAWQGSVAHHDSAGGGGVIGPGDVQWMTAASGVLHKEYHEAEFSRRGGPFHMAQIWVNLPAAHKMDPPRYQAIEAERMGVWSVPEAGGEVRVIAGTHEGVEGPAQTHTPLSMLDIRLRAGASIRLTAPAPHNAALLAMSGDGVLNVEKAVTQGDFVLFDHAGDVVRLSATSDAHFLWLSGEPIDEPVVQHGPFVMNRPEEILEAFRDFQQGKFGSLED